MRPDAGEGRWILFDAVGTLITPDPPVAAAYQAAARRHGSQLDEAAIGARFWTALRAHASTGGATSELAERARWRAFVGQVIDDVRGATAEVLFESLWEHFARPEHWRLYGDVPAALVELTRRGWRLAIASNFDARLRTVVAGHPALTACQPVFISSEIGFVKPDRRFFAAIEAALATRPEDLLLVGDDALHDIAGGQAAGWRTLRISRAGDRDSSPVLRTLADLPAWLEQR
jgi:putative hydrolase of the HAD superfamily